MFIASGREDMWIFIVPGVALSRSRLLKAIHRHEPEAEPVVAASAGAVAFEAEIEVSFVAFRAVVV